MTVDSDLCRSTGVPLKIPPLLGVQRIFSKSCLLSHHPELAPPGLPDHPGGPGGFFMIYQYPNHPAVALTGLLELRLEFNSQNCVCRTFILFCELNSSLGSSSLASATAGWFGYY